MPGWRAASPGAAAAESANAGRVWRDQVVAGLEPERDSVWPSFRGATAAAREPGSPTDPSLPRHARAPSCATTRANLLQQRFVTTTLNRVWVGDFTAVPTQAGWLYVAVLLDLYSRRVIGWAMRGKLDQQLTLEALAMGARQRCVQPGLNHHSDQGAQYSCLAYQRHLATLGITPSMSRKGNCYDNAVAESFFSTLKNELVHHQTYQTRDDASREIFAFIEGLYNRQRLHQSLDYLSPLEFERRIRDP